MFYKALFLPVDKPLEDGCDIINQSGEVFTYNESSDFWRKDAIRRAELFLVSYEFNQIVVIGRPSPEATWLKNGMDVKACDCEEWVYSTKEKKWHGKINAKDVPMSWSVDDYCFCWRIKCPTCQVLH